MDPVEGPELIWVKRGHQCLPPAHPSLHLPLYMHRSGLSSVAQLCKQWELFTMVHHQAVPRAPPHTLKRALTTVAQVFSTLQNESTTQHALKNKRCLKSGKLPQHEMQKSQPIKIHEDYCKYLKQANSAEENVTLWHNIHFQMLTDIHTHSRHE